MYVCIYVSLVVFLYHRKYVLNSWTSRYKLNHADTQDHSNSNNYNNMQKEKQK